ncbi:MAG: hypothetical protein JXA30_15115 [Deltaproteobacteria bacterium]|nr:hypothetical protein [Deltaproteobacteria bacterium]
MDNKQYEIVLEDAEVRLDRLKSLYEQWFQGIERLEPAVPRKNLERQMALLRKEKPRNTRLRFRFQVLIQRYTTYITYWQRTARQIEEGTYRRDVLRVRRQREEARRQRDTEAKQRREQGGKGSVRPEAERGSAKASGDDLQLEPNASGRRPSSVPPRTIRAITPFALPSIPAPDETGFSVRPIVSLGVSRYASDRSPATPLLSSAPAPRASSAPGRTAGLWQISNRGSPPPRPSDPDLSDRRIREIYDRYLYARMKNKEPTETVKMEKLAKTVRELMPKLKQKYAGKSIDFEVVIKNGRVALKPVVK